MITRPRRWLARLTGPIVVVAVLLVPASTAGGSRGTGPGIPVQTDVVDDAAPTFRSLAVKPPASVAGDSATFVARKERLEPFALAGASWDAIAEPGPVRIRVKEPGGWGEWTTLEAGEDGPDPGTAEAAAPSTAVSSPVWFGSATGFEIAATAGVSGLEVHLVAAGDDPTTIGSPIYLPGGAPPIYGRGSWGARPARTSATYATGIRMAFIHHTVSANDYTAGQVPAMLRSIQAYHQNAQGWGDIGYNFIVDRFGRIWHGRDGRLDRAVIGAHTMGFNTGSVGVSVLGDFTRAVPSAAALDSVGQVVGWKLGVAGVNPNGTTTMTSRGNERYPAGTVVGFNTVAGHSDAKPTSCPGLHLYARLGNIRTRAATTAAVVAASPLGTVDFWGQIPAGFRIKGWTADRSAPASPLEIHLYVDGQPHTFLVADDSRPDVGAVFPELGPNHGYDVTIRLPAGPHRLCLYGINVGTGRNSQLGCETVRILDGPFGVIDMARVEPDGAHVRGWALDPDSADAVTMMVVVDGISHTVSASGPRSDVGRRYPGYGSGHGFDVVVPEPRTSLCIDLVNAGLGSNQRLGCPTLNSSPFGRLDVIARAPGGTPGHVRLTGWAIDPNTAGPTQVHVYVNGRGFAFPADRLRPDIERAYPLWGADHGFDVTVPARDGANSICTHAFNLEIGRSTSLGCRTLAVTHSPFGSFDVITRAGGQRRAVGWAIDPDTGRSIAVHFYTGQAVAAAVANRTRHDVARRFPFYGYAHGFDAVVHEGGPVCAYAINTGPGANVLLGCRNG